MAKYIKLFENHNGYTAYTADTENFILPNVSYCVEQDEVHFNKIEPEPISNVIIAKYNVTSTSVPTIIASAITSDVQLLTIDGVELGNVVSSYTFNTLGEHTASFTLKDDVTTLKNYAFQKCTDLTNVTIPNSVSGVGNYTFSGCYNLSSVIIPKGIISIGGGAFLNCSGLTAIIIPSTVVRVGGSAFSGCTSLPVENNIRYADKYAVEATDKSLTTYTLKSDTKWVGSGAFSGCSYLTTIDLPNNVVDIGSSAFTVCGKLASITMPNSVTGIGDSAFKECTSLTSIDLSDKLTTIGTMGLGYCSKLTDITIPNSVTNIAYYAFTGCTRLVSVTCESTTPPTLGAGAFASNASGRKIYVPSESVNAYKAAPNWSTYASYIEPIGGVPVN